MSGIFIGVGSDICPERNIIRALQLLRERVRVAAISTFYLTEALGRPEQPPYYNGVVKIETDIPPVELKYSVLRRIEGSLGRKRTSDRYAPRPIDLDLLIYDGLIMATEDITIPDPEITVREFLAVPLYEIAPDLMIPGLGRSASDVAAGFAHHRMTPLMEFSAQLRRDLLDEPREC